MTGFGEIVDKAFDALKQALTTDELAQLAMILDGNELDPILELLNKHLMIVKPELFTFIDSSNQPPDFGTKQQK